MIELDMSHSIQRKGSIALPPITNIASSLMDAPFTLPKPTLLIHKPDVLQQTPRALPHQQLTYYPLYTHRAPLPTIPQQTVTSPSIIPVTTAQAVPLTVVAPFTVVSPTQTIPTIGKTKKRTTYKTKKSNAQLYCQHCGITETPEWRKGPNGARTLCNACGLYHAKVLKREGPEAAAHALISGKITKRASHPRKPNHPEGLRHHSASHLHLSDTAHQYQQHVRYHEQPAVYQQRQLPPIYHHVPAMPFNGRVLPVPKTF